MLQEELFGVVKRLLQRIRNQGWRNDQYENYILGGKDYKKKKGLESSFLTRNIVVDVKQISNKPGKKSAKAWKKSKNVWWRNDSPI